jgi:hypothetical protein
MAGELLLELDMHIPVISRIVTAVKSWLERIALEREIEFELRLLFECSILDHYQVGEDFESVYASIERKYAAHGFSKKEIKKICDNIGPITMGG